MKQLDRCFKQICIACIRFNFVDFYLQVGHDGDGSAASMAKKGVEQRVSSDYESSAGGSRYGKVISHYYCIRLPPESDVMICVTSNLSLAAFLFWL